MGTVMHSSPGAPDCTLTDLDDGEGYRVERDGFVIGWIEHGPQGYVVRYGCDREHAIRIGNAITLDSAVRSLLG